LGAIAGGLKGSGRRNCMGGEWKILIQTNFSFFFSFFFFFVLLFSSL
jgi:hypothetical protein